MAAGNAWTSLGPRSVRAVCNTGTEAFPVPAKASSTVAFTTAVAGNSVTLHGVTFTATAATTGDNTGLNFQVGTGGSADTDTGTNFAAAVNRYRGTHGCTAVNASGTVTVTADIYGPEGAYALTKVGDPIAVGAAALAGGVAPIGVNCKDVGTVIAQAYATTVGATIATGVWIWGWWHPTTGVYLPVPAMQDTGPAASRGFTLGASSPGLGIPVLFPDGYLAVLPSGVTLSAGTITIDLQAFEVGAGQAGRTM